MALAATSLTVFASAPAHAAPVEIQILATNDFHGRLLNNNFNDEAGAAVLSGAVKQLRTDNPNTAFVAAGDLIGASTFESFIQEDVPTIEALNAAGLDVSAVGNHELDKGFDDLNTRVQNLADWEYIVANLRLKVDNTHPFAPTWTQDFGGVTVGYVGAVTEDLPSLVSPAGIDNLNVTDIVTEVNAATTDLKADGADVVVMLVHEGAPSTDCETMDDSGTWADIINGVDDDVDAIVSGHTHLAYNCEFEVPEWVADERDVTKRPVVSAGQYGSNLNQLVYTVDDATGEVTGMTHALLPLETDPDGPDGPAGFEPNYPPDPAVETIVADAVAEAAVLGARELGETAGAFNRARWSAPDGDDVGTERDIVENRGGESTLGNLVAEVQRWATEAEEFGSAEIAFMNPGGLRANMAAGTITYRQAANVQPFANTLMNMDLTGAQIKTVLEQQWQRDGSGNVPSRPFLRLGVSNGFEYSYDRSLPEGSRITGMWLEGAPISNDTTYSVTANSFLAAGGDNFREFNNAANKRDTGQVDLEAMVAFMAEFAGEDDPPLPVDFSQRSVGATAVGESIELSSLSMTGASDAVDTEVEVFEGETSLGTFPVTSNLSETPFDESGTATLPNPDSDQSHELRVVGATTSTDTLVKVLAVSTVSATADAVTYGTDWDAEVTVTPAAATGDVEILDDTTSLGTATLAEGSADVSIDGTALQPGTHTLTVKYAGDATHAPSEGTLEVEVAKATPKLKVKTKPKKVIVKKTRAKVISVVKVGDNPAKGRIQVRAGGKKYNAKLNDNGRAVVKLKRFGKTGKKKVKVIYRGNAITKLAVKTVTIRVVRR